MSLDAVKDLEAYIKYNSNRIEELAPNFQAYNDLLSTEIIKKIKLLQAERKDLLLTYTPQNAKVKVVDDKLKDLIEQASVVIDATDNFDSRFLLNELCVKACTPLVSGAAIRMEGQVCVFLNHEQRGPCYRCLYRNEGDNEESCSETGVLAPVVGIIGSIQAVEALKIIANMGQTLNNRVLLLDAMTMEWRT